MTAELKAIEALLKAAKGARDDIKTTSQIAGLMRAETLSDDKRAELLTALEQLSENAAKLAEALEQMALDVTTHALATRPQHQPRKGRMLETVAKTREVKEVTDLDRVKALSAFIAKVMAKDPERAKEILAPLGGRIVLPQQAEKRRNAMIKAGRDDLADAARKRNARR
jgi:hypothetical protein